jgi:hypothetical protein
MCDKPVVSDDLRKEHPGYLRNNIWPTQEDCPGFTEAVKALSKFMTETGCLLAKACDDLVSKHSDVPSVESLISASKCSKARLLHYYPPAKQVVRLQAVNAGENDGSNERADSWYVI